MAAWYAANGWAYPVQGPASTGLAAVQQFFEALGLTAPPKVEISDRSLTLFGKPGDMGEALQLAFLLVAETHDQGDGGGRQMLNVGTAGIDRRCLLRAAVDTCTV